MNNILCKSDFIDFIDFNEFNENKYNVEKEKRDEKYNVFYRIVHLWLLGFSIVICITLFYHSIMYLFL